MTSDDRPGNDASATYTNYSLLCRVPTEDDKLYYWDNFERLIPVLDPLMSRFALTKVISWQHFNRIRWNAKTHSNHASSRDAPTGGSNNRWCRADLEKIFTLYLNDRTYHYHAWNRDAGPLPKPPVDKRGYPMHYMTVVLGNIAPLKAIGSTDWYNRQTDFRFQIPYYFGQFDQTNMMVEFCFRNGSMAASDMDDVVRAVARQVHCTKAFKRSDIPGAAFVHTYERVITDRPDDAVFWTSFR